jgi:TldD protein
MKNIHNRWNFLSGTLITLFTCACFAGPGRSGAQNMPPVLTAMQEELDRSMGPMSKSDPPLYFLSYTVTDAQDVQVSGSNGALLSSEEGRRRRLEIQARVGSYQLDNTHHVGDGPTGAANPGAAIPLDDDIDVLRRAIWRETDKRYRNAAEQLIKIQTSKEVQVQTSENRAPDFTHEEPHVSIGASVGLHVDRKPWEQRVRKYTAAFSQSPATLNSIVTFTAQASNQYQVSSEGSKLAFGQIRYRLELFVQSKAPDGMDIDRFANFDWVNPGDAPSDDAVMQRIAELTKEVEALDRAPLVEPFAGPVMLTGRAAAVFFHEVFGHRVEGSRLKDSSEGQTFTHKIGEKIMPDFISIKDDPTEAKLGSSVLLGNYPFDDEGVRAQDTHLVEHGVLKTFLMSRTPLEDVPLSNGHGRRQPGYVPTTRQGNLIVSSSRTVSEAELRRIFIEQIESQHKPFGLRIDDVEGGFTFTGRGQPQAFQILPLVVYKVYPGGRPDELVRGVDLSGTPLVALTKIVATGDTTETFNGYCGSDSGSVPVSASAPPMVFSEMEIQKKLTSTDRPPILPPPLHDPEGAKP